MQGYAFVEYSVPNGALKCKEGMDKIEAEMRPDFRRKACSLCACVTHFHTPVCLYTAHSAGKIVCITLVHVQAQVHICPRYKAANL